MSAVYKQKLADPRWQKLRLDIFNRDNWTCQQCGDKTTQLEIHHTSYWAGIEPWEYPGDMLITVCHKCHGAEQVRFKYENSLVTALREKGFLAMEIEAIAQMIFMFPHFRQTLKSNIKKFIDRTI
jgi:hypothetical protein